VQRSDIWVNGGYFIFKKEIFEYLKDGEELVHEPFNRMIAENELITYKHDGFWVSMDTFKDKQLLDDMYHRGETPWEVWKTNDCK
jgi:glucose-1-phosphate cytidylyltransferase